VNERRGMRGDDHVEHANVRIAEHQMMPGLVRDVDNLRRLGKRAGERRDSESDGYKCASHVISSHRPRAITSAHDRGLVERKIRSFSALKQLLVVEGSGRLSRKAHLSLP
jgi:hypothetical protein